MTTFEISTLKKMRRFAGKMQTKGLGDATIESFLKKDSDLPRAIKAASEKHASLRRGALNLLTMSENDLCTYLQKDYLSFYGEDARCPYVPLAASGPWIVTTHGAVIHDSGGYGMLGMGHDPQDMTGCLSTPQAMANIMTPSLSQRSFANCLKKEIGHTRGGSPFHQYLCMNSGSESVTVASRICDLHAHHQTNPGAKHAGKTVYTLSLEGSFHGRTELAARASHSTFETYKSNLASYRDRKDLHVVSANDLGSLNRTFERAEANGHYIDALFLEPVLGEGVPGLAITPEFYALARELTRTHDAMLVVDSIQSGLRASGHLSIVDYPGFENIEAPDMETYSKALNGGQYPLSVLAMTERAANRYVEGIYGNTMTANPRALDVGCAVLNSITDDLRANIQKSGAYFLEGLKQLRKEFPSYISDVNGTGLIVSAEMNPTHHTVTGQNGLEGKLRRQGISMVHAGDNGLRFTPHFAITIQEIDMILEVVQNTLGMKMMRPSGDTTPYS